LTKTIHDRMPVLLRRDDEKAWLDTATVKPDDAKELLKPFPPELMDAYAVSTLVNSPVNERPECSLPVEG